MTNELTRELRNAAATTGLDGLVDLLGRAADALEMRQGDAAPTGELTDPEILHAVWVMELTTQSSGEYRDIEIARAVIAADRALRASPTVDDDDDAAESVNETNTVLATRYFEALKKLEAYEKNGVTCQTFRHFVDSPCAECNAVVGPSAGDVAHEKQLNACKSLIASLERQRTTLREGAEKWAEAVKSLISEREANAILTSEIATLTAERDAGVEPTAATRDVLAERQRQISVEGWKPEHDDEHGNGELASAAGCYIQGHSYPPKEKAGKPAAWPWTAEWWKPKDQRSNLVRAGALLLAEIERIDRAVMAKEPK